MTTSAQSRFIPLGIHSSDEHYGADRPVAVILRLNAALEAKVAQVIALLQGDLLMAGSISLTADDVRWIRTVGFTSDNGLAPVDGEHLGAPAWMPADANICPIDVDLLNMDVDNDDRADYREDCAVYESQSEPAEATACLHLEWMTAPGRDYLEIHFAVQGRTATFAANSLLFPARDAWPHLIAEVAAPCHRDRQAA